jgi:hypothetical protein
LFLETPHGNLVAGLQWLQATFANRFNKLREAIRKGQALHISLDGCGKGGRVPAWPVS